MKKFLSIGLSILLALVLLGTILLGIIQKDVSFSTITDLAKSMIAISEKSSVSSGLYYPGKSSVVTLVQYEMIDPSQLDISQLDFSSMSLDELGISSLISQFTPDADIDEEFLEEIMTDSETADFEDYSGETIDRTGLHEIISTSIETATPEIASAMDEIKEENSEVLEMLAPLMILLKPSTLYCAIAICAVLALLILLINRNIASWFKYISVPGIVVGLILFIGALVVFAMLPDVATLIELFAIPEALAAPVLMLITKIIMQFRTAGIIAGVTGIILLVAGCILGKKKA